MVLFSSLIVHLENGRESARTRETAAMCMRERKSVIVFFSFQFYIMQFIASKCQNTHTHLWHTTNIKCDLSIASKYRKKWHFTVRIQFKTKHMIGKNERQENGISSLFKETKKLNQCRFYFFSRKRQICGVSCHPKKKRECYKIIIYWQ